MEKSSGQYRVQVTWLWRAAFRFISPEGKFIFIDPWLKDNPLCPTEYKELDKLQADVVLYTHDHFDHEGDTAEIAKNTGAMVIASVDLMQSLQQKGVDRNQIIPLSYRGAAHVAGITAAMVPAWHTTAPSVGFVISFSSGFAIYHPGDTCLFSDFSECCFHWNLPFLHTTFGEAPKITSRLNQYDITFFIENNGSRLTS